MTLASFRITNVLAAVLAACTLAATPALAQDDPGEVVRNAAAAMHEASDRTVEAVRDGAAQGVATINRLDDNGATDRELTAAARRATSNVNQTARHGLRRIDLIASRAANILRDLEADRSFFEALGNARRAAAGAIHDSRDRGTHAIQAALRAALDD